jgi:putrescine aminotransferase
MDPIPGSNIGFPVPPDGYLQGVRSLCDKFGILLIFDEVQTGFGKTGKMFACEHWGVAPDILCIGKGFTGGYIPLGATVTTEKVYSVFRRAGHELRSGSTYGGHTLACAATLANIEIIERKRLPERAGELGKVLRARLEALRERHRIVGQVSGIGLLQALFLNVDPARKVGSFIRDFCWQNGMILRNNGDILVFAPALIITEAELEQIVGTLDRALSAAEKRLAR